MTVVLPLLHGPMGEDGTVQGLLELADAAYVGSGVLGSALAMDKAMAKQVLAANGIPQPRFRALRDTGIVPGISATLAAEFGLPCFVKPSNMGSSVGVTKAHDVEELATPSSTPSRTTSGWWSRRRCQDVRSRSPCSAAPNRWRPAPARSSPVRSSTATRTSTSPTAPSCSCRRRCRRRTPSTCADLAVDVFKALRCDGLARVDFFLEQGGRGFLCNEANTMPGFTPISMFPKLQAAGLSYLALIDRLVELAIERKSRRRRNTKH